jgi:hypothetical protein
VQPAATLPALLCILHNCVPWGLLLLLVASLLNSFCVCHAVIETIWDRKYTGKYTKQRLLMSQLSKQQAGPQRAAAAVV